MNGIFRAVKQKTSEDFRFWILLLALAAAGVVLMVYITPYGMGLVNDSVGYIGGARNILAGNGYSRLSGNGDPRPITNYPPLFSIAIAAVITFFDPDVVALGGGVIQSADLLIGPILQKLEGKVPRTPPIIASSLGHRAAALGAMINLLHNVSDFYIVRKLS
jgi:hypothetical protein